MNIRDGGGGRRRWETAGRPAVPALAVAGVVTTILHRSQIGLLLGLEVPDEGEAAALARDCAAVLEAWTMHLEGLPFPLLTAPTPSRGRSLRNLTVNVFHPFELLPAVPADGRFEWNPDGDAEREQRLRDADEVRAYAARIGQAWSAFVRDSDGADEGLLVSSPRGEITWSSLLAQQRWHAAYHYRQLTSFLAEEGQQVVHRLRLDGMAGLDLPDEVF